MPHRASATKQITSCTFLNSQTLKTLNRNVLKELLPIAMHTKALPGKNILISLHQ